MLSLFKLNLNSEVGAPREHGKSINLPLVVNVSRNILESEFLFVISEGIPAVGSEL